MVERLRVSIGIAPVLPEEAYRAWLRPDRQMTLRAGALHDPGFVDDLEERGTPRTELLIEGTLLTSGTADRPVTLSTLSDNPSRGQWEGITVDDGALADLSYTQISYAVGGIVAEDGAELIVNRQTRQWGTDYDPTLDLG